MEVVVGYIQYLTELALQNFWILSTSSCGILIGWVHQERNLVISFT